MKNNNSWYPLLFNPFTKIAGWKAFVIGALIVITTVIIGSFFNISFWGVMDVKVTPGVPIAYSFLFQIIGLAGTVLFMYLLTLIFTRNVRFQDILGTVTLSRFPLIFVALAGFILSDRVLDGQEMITSILNGTFSLTDYTDLFIFLFITMIFVIWSLILLYNALKISSGLNVTKTIVVLIITFFLSEIFSNVSIYFLSINS